MNGYDNMEAPEVKPPSQMNGYVNSKYTHAHTMVHASPANGYAKSGGVFQR